MIPEAGRRYRLSGEVHVEGVYRNAGEEMARCLTSSGKWVHLSTRSWDWEELEPSYAEGALYIDARDQVFRRERLGSWLKVNTGNYYSDPYPARPLKRLIVEGEE